MREHFLKSRKGLTLIEIIISLAVFAILAVPLAAIFGNSISVVKKTDTQIAVNEIMRIIEKNVVYAVKMSEVLIDYDTSTNVQVRNGNTLISGTFKIIDENGNSDKYKNYKFTLTKKGDFGYLADFPNTCEYQITLKTANNKVVKSIRIKINKLPAVYN